MTASIVMAVMCVPIAFLMGVFGLAALAILRGTGRR